MTTTTNTTDPVIIDCPDCTDGGMITEADCATCGSCRWIEVKPTTTTGKVVRTYPSGAVEINWRGGDWAVVSADGGVSAASQGFWAAPESFGAERVFCPGHRGVPCPYGMHDFIRCPIPEKSDLACAPETSS